MMPDDGKRLTKSNIKTVTSAVLAATVMTVFLLVGIFVIDKFTVSAQTSAEYWTEKGLAGLATFLIMLSVANVCEEQGKKRDKDYTARMTSIDEHYRMILQNGEVDDLERYITNINRANKYRAYVLHVKKRIKRARKESKRKELEDRLLLSPDEVWADVERVRFDRVTYSLLFSDAAGMQDKDDDYDLVFHRGQMVLRKFLTKALMVVAFGAVATDIAFSLSGFDVVQFLLKLCVMFMAVYSGVLYGMGMVERGNVILKRKTRILSQFRKREDSMDVSDAERFAVEVLKDPYIEKLKAARAAEIPEIMG